MSCTSRKSTTTIDHSGNYLNLLDADALLMSQQQQQQQQQQQGLRRRSPQRPSRSAQKHKEGSAPSTGADDAALTENRWIKPTMDALLQSSNALVTKISPGSRRRDKLNYKQVSVKSTTTGSNRKSDVEESDGDDSFNGLESGLAEYLKLSTRALSGSAGVHHRAVKVTGKAEHARKEFIKAAPNPEELFTKEQLGEFRRAFDLFDHDKDQLITTREALTLVRSLGQDPSMEDISKMMSTLDINGNGTVDFEEFLTVISKLMENEPTEADLVEIFRVMDQDGDGYISIGDLRDINNRLNLHLTTMDLEEMFLEVDQDGDRRCDFEEFMKIIRTVC